ncbi:hypothetical protein AAG906_017928 [Vitis piasezkii]
MVGAHNHLNIDHSASFVASMVFDTGATHYLSQSVDPLSDVQPHMVCADNNTFFEFHPRFFLSKIRSPRRYFFKEDLNMAYIDSCHLYVTRHVVFHETVFSFQSTLDQSSSVVIVPTPALLPCSSPPMSSLPSHTTPSTSSPPLTNMPSSTTSLPNLIQVPLADISTSEPHPTNQHPMVTRAKNGINKKKAYFSSHISEPTTFTQVVKDSNWVLAMEKEFFALQRNKTWHLVPPPSNGNIIGCKWVYKLKYKPDGTLAHCKASYRPPGHGIPNSALHFLVGDFKLLELTARCLFIIQHMMSLFYSFM